MRRISNENGREAGARNAGRLMLGLIPLALGLGAAVWLGVYIDAHYFRKAMVQEQRAAEFVGVTAPLASPIKIEVGPSEFCANVTRADISGRVLKLYATNNCTTPLSRMEWHYEAISPNGTILDRGYLSDGCSFPRLVGDSAECVFGEKYEGVKDDSRIATLRVWTVPYRP